MTLDLNKNIESLPIKYSIIKALYNTSTEQNLDLRAAQSVSNNLKCRNLIGALLYISVGTRLDVAYSVNYLSRIQNCYDETHFKYALRILKYLYATRNLKRTYTLSISVDVMDCSADADRAVERNDRKPTAGDVIRMYGDKVY